MAKVTLSLQLEKQGARSILIQLLQPVPTFGWIEMAKYIEDAVKKLVNKHENSV
jgi:hypothetical protein